MKKLSVIYEPTGQAREYAKLALNIYKGCTHRCIYCYNNGRFGKKGEFFKSANPRSLLIGRLIHDCTILDNMRSEVQDFRCPEILLTFLGDAYQPAEKTLELTRLVVRTLIGFDLLFTILTKSPLITRDIDLLSNHPKFRVGFSFTSITPVEVAKWEPGTAYIEDRIKALRRFHSAGVGTWVSLEPVMSVSSTILAIRKLPPFTDFFKIGALNHMEPPVPYDRVEARREIQAELEFYRCSYKFKKSLTDL